MVIHVLNCATIRLYLPAIKVATCCLLVEWGEGLILVDTGLGVRDYSNPAIGLRFIKRLTHTFGSPEEAAVKQIARLGYSPAKVRHIIMTHLHVDHAGGLSDFPDATVHVFRTELENANTMSVLRGIAYISAHWAHGPNWHVHDWTDEIEWFGFKALPVLENDGLQILFVPLPGHSRGHCGVVIGDGSHWVLHCGDAVVLDALQTRPDSFSAKLLGPNFQKLYKLSQNHKKEVQIIPAHVFADKVPIFLGGG